MIGEILVCLEGSPSGRSAVEAAIRIGRATGAGLVGLAIVDEPDIRAGAATGIGGASYKAMRDDALVEQAEEQVKVWLDEFRGRCQQAGVRARTLEEHGQTAATILTGMDSHDLLVLGRHANFKFATTAEDPDTRDEILHRARKPVLVVPEPPLLDSKQVLVAFDGSSASRRAVCSFAESGLAAGCDVHVACADDDGASAFEMATRGVDLFAQFAIKARPSSLVSALPIASALLQAGEKMRAGLIVMGAYAHSRISQLLWGSVTQQLVETTPVPLYLHH